MPPPEERLMPPALRLTRGPAEREDTEGAETERDLDKLPTLDRTLRPASGRERRAGAETRERDGLTPAERFRETSLREPLLPAKTRELAREPVFCERLSRAELDAERGPAADSAPRLDGLTREALLGAKRPDELRGSARETRA
jgi:hypothetical protein